MELNIENIQSDKVNLNYEISILISEFKKKYPFLDITITSSIITDELGFQEIGVESYLKFKD